MPAWALSWRAAAAGRGWRCMTLTAQRAGIAQMGLVKVGGRRPDSLVPVLNDAFTPLHSFSHYQPEPCPSGGRERLARCNSVCC